MKANTALGFLAIALSLGALRRPASGRVRLGMRTTALAVAGLALGTVAQNLFAWDLGIDRGAGRAGSVVPLGGRSDSRSPRA